MRDDIATDRAKVASRGDRTGDGRSRRADSSRGTEETGGLLVLPAALTQRWWLPVAFIALALLLLLLTPIVVNHQVTLIRRDVVDVADEARVQVNDLQAAYVARLFASAARNEHPGALVDSTEAANIGKGLRDESSLDSLVRRLGPVPTARLGALVARSRAWQSILDARANGGDRVSLGAETAREGLALLAAAEALDDELLRISNAARDRVRYYAELNLITTSALTPFALAALATLVWVGWRIVSLAREIERERTELHRAIRARVALIHGVTHDVKNPLGAAIGYVELLQEGVAGPVPVEQKNMLARVRRLMDVALHTVAELLETARSEAGAPASTLSRVDLGALVEELVEDYAASAVEKAIHLGVAEPGDHVVATTDADRVRRIVGNLLSNAVKYSRHGGRVVVAVRRGTAADDAASVSLGRCMISVCDDGPGVAAEVRERLFTDFFRAPGAEARAEGQGMGLASSRRLARALGGDVRFVESPLGGAGFVLELPM